MVNTEETFPEIREVRFSSEYLSAKKLFRVAMIHAIVGVVFVSFSSLIIFAGFVLLPIWCVGSCVLLGVWSALGPGDYFKRITVAYVLAVIVWLPLIFIYIVFFNSDSDLGWLHFKTAMLLIATALFTSQVVPALLRWFAGWHLVHVSRTADAVTLPNETGIDYRIEPGKEEIDFNQFSISFLLKLTLLIAILAVSSRVLLKINPTRLYDFRNVFLVFIVAQAILLPAIIYYFRKILGTDKLMQLGLFCVALLLASSFFVLFGIMADSAVGLVGLVIMYALAIALGVFATVVYGLSIIFEHGYRIKIVKHGQTQMFPK